MPDFSFIDGKVAIGEIGDLVKGLAPSSNFEQVFTVNQKVSVLGTRVLLVTHIYRTQDTYYLRDKSKGRNGRKKSQD